MPYKDITYDNGFTERFYYNETLDEEALRMSRANYVKSFSSTNHRASLKESIKIQEPQSPLHEG